MTAHLKIKDFRCVCKFEGNIIMVLACGATIEEMQAWIRHNKYRCMAALQKCQGSLGNTLCYSTIEQVPGEF